MQWPLKCKKKLFDQKSSCLVLLDTLDTISYLSTKFGEKKWKKSFFFTYLLCDTYFECLIVIWSKVNPKSQKFWNTATLKNSFRFIPDLKRVGWRKSYYWKYTTLFTSELSQAIV